MNKLSYLIALGITLAFVCPAGAITADGDWSDWFTYSGNVNANNWNEMQVTLVNQSIRTQNDEEGPTPGGGGQFYDIEQIFYAYEDSDPNASTGGRLYVGLVTGFPPGGIDVDNLYSGDMFFDFGNTGGYDLAVATSTSAVNMDTLTALDSECFAFNYFNDGTDNWQLRDPTSFVSSGPWRVERNSAIENLFTSTVAWGNVGSHNFLEICVEVDGTLEEVLTNAQGGVGLHWTMECGNDVIDVRDDTPLNPMTPIYEPYTFTLLGLGMLGMVLRQNFAA